MLGSGRGQRLALECERDSALGLERGTDHIARKAARLAAVRTRLKVEGRGCGESAQANLPILQHASPRRRSPQKREGARRRGSPGDRLHRRERLSNPTIELVLTREPMKELPIPLLGRDEAKKEIDVGD